MISSTSGIAITGGMFNNATNMNISQPRRGTEFFMDWIAPDAFHNSKELYDAPSCHPQTRVAVLADIMRWVTESGEDQDEFIMWLFGPAGAGKSAIAKKIAELAVEKGVLIGSFFFSRASPTRSTQDRLVATLAYQMALSIPGTRTHIEHVIETDPAIFHKDIQTQIDALLMKPFQFASTEIIPFQKLFIIDGLDECSDRQAQVTILVAISRSFTTHNLPIRCLIVSRPETDIVASFNSRRPLKYIHRYLCLDDEYHPDDDIHLFLSDKFEEIRCTHRLKSTIPIPWPTQESLDALITKSSGQFIFAATVVRFVESNRHRPATRLDIVLGISPAGTVNPFAELDALYKQVLSSVRDIQLTLRVLSLYTSMPHLPNWLGYLSMSERFLSLEEGDIDRALIDLSSIVSYNVLSGEVKILHPSFVDFLFDQRRSAEFYIDMASACTGFACRILQFVRGPDGIRAGDVDVLVVGFSQGGWILNEQLRSEMLHFDFDAFITAAIKSPYWTRRHSISKIFDEWMSIISMMGLEDGDEQLLIRRCRRSFESRIQQYQSDTRLQLLLTLATVARNYSPNTEVQMYRRLDILLEMDDNDLCRLDQNALDFHYSEGFFAMDTRVLSDITSRYVDGDRYASAALHCMRFLSHPPKYYDSNDDSPEMGRITYAEWKATCYMALVLLREVLKQANTSLEVIQFMSDHDIDTRVRKKIPVQVIDVDTYILWFLSRAGVCINWRIISAIRRALSTTDTLEQSESAGETDSESSIYETADGNEPEDTGRIPRRTGTSG